MDNKTFLSLFHNDNDIWAYGEGWVRGEKKGIRPIWETSTEYGAHRENIYFTPGNFITDTEKTQANVRGARALWLDVDANHDDKTGCKYDSAVEAEAAAKSFLEKFGLTGLFVRSGHGVQVFILINQEIDNRLWHELSAMLAAAASAYGLDADTTRTQDISSFMRLPNTLNRYRQTTPVVEASVVDATMETAVRHTPTSIRKLLSSGMKGVDTNLTGPTERGDADILSVAGISAKALEKLVSRARMEELVASSMASVQAEGMYDANQIADKCLIIGQMRERRGRVQEPVWYHTLQVLQYAQNGAEYAHQWSEGHPGYSQKETDERLERLKGHGATTCKKFESVAPIACRECPHHGRIHSPIDLGRIVPSEREQGEYFKATFGVEPVLPPGYAFAGKRNGIIFPTEDGAVDVTTLPVFVGRVLEEDTDEQREKYEVCILTPDGFPKKCVLGGSFLVDDKGIAGALSDIGYRGAPEMDGRLGRFMRLQSVAVVEKHGKLAGFTKYGWSERKQAFYTGGKLMGATGEREGYLIGGKDYTVPVVPDLERWRLVVAHYLKAPLPFRLSFFSSFASVLPVLLGMDIRLFGFSLNLYSPHSGIGKSTSLRAAMAVWGEPDMLMGAKNDTYNSLMKKAATHQHLPMYVDEMTTTDEVQLAQMIYNISSGRERGRLNQDATMKEALTWANLWGMTSNRSLVNMIPLDQSFDGVSARILEYETAPYTDLKTLNGINAIASQNYGTLGPLWVRHVLQNKNEMDRTRQKMLEGIAQKSPHMVHRYQLYISIVETAILGVCKMLSMTSGAIAKDTMNEFVETARAGKVCQVQGPAVTDLHTERMMRVQEERLLDQAMAVANGRIGKELPGGAISMFGGQMPLVVTGLKGMSYVDIHTARKVGYVVERYRKVCVDPSGAIIQKNIPSMASFIVVKTYDSVKGETHGITETRDTAAAASN